MKDKYAMKSDFSKIIECSTGLNELLWACYKEMNSKNFSSNSPFEKNTEELENRIKEIYICFKRVCLDISDNLSKYIKDYIDFLKDFLRRSRSYRVEYSLYFSGRLEETSQALEAEYSDLRMKIKKTNAGEVFSEEELYNRITNSINKKEMVENKANKLFISHSSNDKEYVEALAELLESIGMTDDSFVCTSVPGHGVPGGERIFDWLRKQFIQYNLRVLFVLSHNYYESEPSLNEMGAAWVMKTTYTLMLLPGFQFSDIRGCIDSTEMGISFNSDEGELKHRLNELKNTLVSEYGLPGITDIRWERQRDKFIKTVKDIATNNTPESQSEIDNKLDRDSSHLSGKTLNSNASTMLFFAAEGGGRILVSDTLSGSSYVAGRNPLNKSDEPRELAKWDAAVDQLVERGLIKLVGTKDRVYMVTEAGYMFSDRLKDTYKLDANMTPGNVLDLIEGIIISKMIKFIKEDGKRE